MSEAIKEISLAIMAASKEIAAAYEVKLAALRADRDQWKERAEKPDAVQGLEGALQSIFVLDKCPSPGDGCSQCIARASLKAWEEAKAGAERKI